MNPRIKQRLEQLSNIATIAVCLLLAVEAGPRLKAYMWPTPPPPSIQRGDRFPTDLGIQFAQADTTVVLAVQSSCVYCSASMAFYRRLADASQKSKFRLIAASPEAVSVTEDYLKENGVQASQVVTVPLSRLAISGTPTLLVIDRNGIVAGVWRGKLDKPKEQRLLAELRVETTAAALIPQRLPVSSMSPRCGRISADSGRPPRI